LNENQSAKPDRDLTDDFDEDKGDKTRKEHSTEMAQARTAWAEDRTVLANERTFAGWMRTGMAAAGIALGFRALFRESEQVLLSKISASLFLMIAIFIFWSASRSSMKVVERLDCYATEPQPKSHLAFIASLFGVATLILGIVLWML